MVAKLSAWRLDMQGRKGGKRCWCPTLGGGTGLREGLPNLVLQLPGVYIGLVSVVRQSASTYIKAFILCHCKSMLKLEILLTGLCSGKEGGRERSCKPIM
jgi:hypothetical protein